MQRTALEKGLRSRYLDGIAQGNSSSEEDSVTDNSQNNEEEEVAKKNEGDATRNAIASEDGAGGGNNEEEDVDFYDKDSYKKKDEATTGKPIDKLDVSETSEDEEETKVNPVMKVNNINL